MAESWLSELRLGSIARRRTDGQRDALARTDLAPDTQPLHPRAHTLQAIAIPMPKRGSSTEINLNKFTLMIKVI